MEQDTLDLEELLYECAPSAIDGRSRNCLPAQRLRDLAVHLSDFPMEDLQHTLECDYCRRSLHLLRRYELHAPADPIEVEDEGCNPPCATRRRPTGRNVIAACVSILFVITTVWLARVNLGPSSTFANDSVNRSEPFLQEVSVGDCDTRSVEDEVRHVSTVERVEDTRRYTVRPGDSLSVIALRELGSAKKVSDILDLNHTISDPDRIRVGDVLNLPVRKNGHAFASATLSEW